MSKMEKVKDLTLEEWIDISTKPREISLWGSICDTSFSPELCSKIEGDGKQLIYFGTIDQRPKWWLMQIDSGHDVKSNEFDIEGTVIDTLVDEFGESEQYISEDEFERLKSEGDEECIICDSYKEWLSCNWSYPRLQISGHHWGVIVNMKTGEHE